MDTYKVVKEISNFCLEESKNFNGDGTKNYAYAFGRFTRQMEIFLYEMDLTEEQEKVLTDFLNKINN